MKKLNWKPVIKSLLTELIHNGYTIENVDNGEEEYFTDDIDEATSLIDATDESYLTISKGKTRSCLFIVLGNSPHELVSDFSMPQDKIDAADLEHTLINWSDSWEGRVCPTEEEFDPKRSFESPEEALVYCKENALTWEQSIDRVLAITKHNMMIGEYGFAAELVKESTNL